ncbi:MAG: hypothetical protein K9G49_16335 [Taibaiella sp.]|nr:hypothetical protein [Taibaiella sp.]
MNKNNTNIIIAVALVLIAATARVASASLQMPNFVPIAAISLFSGAILKDKRAFAFLIPLLGQFAADVYFQLFTYVPGFYWAVDQLFTYAAIGGATALGFGLKQQKPLNILGFTLGASAIFFIVSNFGYFAHGWNGYSLSGLAKTYIDAIPFYKNSFIADMAGCVVLFGGYHALLKSQIVSQQHAKA